MKSLEKFIDTLDVFIAPQTSNPFETKMYDILSKSDNELIGSDWRNVGDDLCTAMEKTQLRLNEQTFTPPKIGQR